ncbi:glycoside hydrolase [Gleimia sp. 6138-11-ORH1]|uniref:sialidase family protein n=1 Tax=Gleimia sp. 6138-11-ORH1 TaxID=2973937 RepID=UPI00216747A8|nr:sialidase family protein [Gleimia sp. 6138-11-ORH1]MCS4483951.1 glycoside hydrolase [Gleimia sp. 6138-11-ORH1]
MELNVETRRQRLVGAIATITLIASPLVALPTAFATEANPTTPVAVNSTAEEATTLPNVSVEVTPAEDRVYNVGETIRFNIKISNQTQTAYGLQILPTETNLKNIEKCRWSTFAAGKVGDCNTRNLQATHLVTAADAQAGQFVPEYALTLYTPAPNSATGYRNVVAKFPKATGAPVKVANPVVPQPPTPDTPAPAPQIAEISFQLRSQKNGPWSLGDLLEYTIHVKNISGAPRGFTPIEGNLDGWQRCKWTRPFPDQTTKSDCNFVSHRITAEDVARGYFEPFITYQGVPKVTGDRVLIRPEAIRLDLENFEGEKALYTVGDVLRFPVKVVSLGSEAYTLRTEGTNLTFSGAKCDGQLAVGQSLNCEVATHTITEDDLEVGFFSPTLTVSAVGTNNEVAGTASLKFPTINLPHNYSWPKAGAFTPADYNPAGTTAGGLTDEIIIAQQNGDNFYRIPALTVAPNGDLLASYDHRPNHAGDTPNANSIVQRRSSDNGRTWGPETYIAKAQGIPGRTLESFSDPSYVVDYTTGKIFNFHVKGYNRGWGNARYHFNGDQVQVGHRDSMDLHVSVSDDNGRTWTHKVITDQLLNGRTDALKAFATSGNGIQIQHGKYKGRLVQPAAWGLRDGKVVAGAIYSDDHGASWKLGQWTPVQGADGTYRWDENKIVELSDGRLMINSRVSGGPATQARVRAIAYSSDGGVTWSAPQAESQLTDPVNNAHIIRAFPTAPAGSAKAKVLFFSNAKNPNARVNGTITVSCDDGKTWKNDTAKQYFAGHMGYSSITVLNDGSVGILSEVAGASIRFQRFDSSWLGNQCDLTETPPPPATPDFSINVEPTEKRVYTEGEKIWFRISVENKSDQAYGLQIAAEDTNLSRTDKCRWSTFAAGQSGTCSNENLMAWHVVTAEDVAAGSFTPHYALSLYQPYPSNNDKRYQELLHKLPRVTLDPIQVAPAAPKAEIRIALNNPKTTPWTKGEVLSYTVLVKNTSGQTRGFIPESSNLTGYQRCRWTAPFANGVTKRDCNFLTHEITDEDIARGYFEPRIKYREVAEAVGQKVIVRAPAISLVPTAVTPQADYAIGDKITFGAEIVSNSQNPLTLQVEYTNGTVKADSCAGTLAANERKACVIEHTVTEEDLITGFFTPRLRISALENGETVQVVELPANALPLPTTHQWPAAKAFKPHNFNPESSAAGGLTEEIIIAQQHGRVFYRIPALTVAANGDLLASYDYRPNHAGDTPNPNSIVQRRSKDNGKTWGPETFIAKASGTQWQDLNSYSDPSYVVDYTTGELFNFHVKGHNRGWHNGARYQFDADGNTTNDHPDAMDFHVASSTDNGYTWKHRVITAEILKGRTDAVKAFATSGDGIQIRHGKYKGRLLQPAAWHLSDGTTRAAVIYSDDHGKSWKLGEWTAAEGEGGRHNWDENKVVELEDGRIMINSRVSAGEANRLRVRLVAYSEDGGVTWGASKIETELTDPVNNAHIIRAFPTAKPGTPEAKVLLFSNTKNPRSRVNGSITVSCDSGDNWNNAQAKTYNPGHTGYSSLAILPDGTVGVLSEVSGASIRFQRFDASWLGKQCDLPGLVDEDYVPAPEVNPALTLDAGTLLAGQQVTGSFSGYTPNGEVRIELHSTPVVLGQVTASATGTGTFSFTIPEGTLVGLHNIVVVDVTTNKLARLPLIVNAAPSDGGKPKPPVVPPPVDGKPKPPVVTPPKVNPPKVTPPKVAPKTQPALPKTGAEIATLGGISLLTLVLGSWLFMRRKAR